MFSLDLMINPHTYMVTDTNDPDAFAMLSPSQLRAIKKYTEPWISKLDDTTRVTFRYAAAPWDGGCKMYVMRSLDWFMLHTDDDRLHLCAAGVYSLSDNLYTFMSRAAHDGTPIWMGVQRA